ncbi:MAG: hypothetical protein R3B53_00765 [Candidatus Paceibacterota bacterium]
MLSTLRQALVQRKAIEEQVKQALKPMEPTLRFIAELQAVYQEVYGCESSTEISVEAIPKPAKQVKPKTKKEVLFTPAKVDLPSGATWRDITIAFQNKEDVEIKYKDTIIGRYSHQDLGFAQENTGWKNPDRRWALLTVLAVAGEFKSQTIITKDHLMNVCDVKTQNAVEKRKSDLATGLRLAFGIQEEPFERYSHETGYCSKFTLLPEADLRGNGELRHSGVTDFSDSIYSDD